jgi:uncharacterized protein (TIGR00251 family)
MSVRIEQSGSDVLLWVKAVPGASRDEVAGRLGERFKVRVAAAAEGGKANKAICRLIARTLSVKPIDVTIEAGQTQPEKIVRIADQEVGDVEKQLRLAGIET